MIQPDTDEDEEPVACHGVRDATILWSEVNPLAWIRSDLTWADMQDELEGLEDLLVPELWCGQHGRYKPPSEGCEGAFDPADVVWLVEDDA